MVPFPQIFPPKPCMHPFCFPYVVRSTYHKEAFTLSQLLICRYDEHVSITRFYRRLKIIKFCLTRVWRMFTIIKKRIVTTNKNNQNVRLIVPAPTLDIDLTSSIILKRQVKNNRWPCLLEPDTYRYWRHKTLLNTHLSLLVPSHWCSRLMN